MPRWLAAGLAVVSVLWVGAILLAPFGRMEDSAAAWLVYHAASGICHQRPDRSLHLAGVPLPVCARCFGLYASGAAGASAAWLVASGIDRLTRHARTVLILAAVPTIATFLLERFGLAPVSSAVRALAALPLGGAAGWVFVRSLRAERPEHVRAPLDAL